MKNMDNVVPGDEVFSARSDESCGFVLSNNDREISISLDAFPDRPLRLDKSRQKRDVPCCRVPVERMKAVVGDILFFHKQWRASNG